jgi:hypothetical protein
LAAKRRFLVFVRIAAATFAAAVLVNLLGEPTRDLPGGWTLKFFDGAFEIRKQKKGSLHIEKAAGPHVNCYQVVGSVITGHVVADVNRHPPELFEGARPGYFVIDATTQHVWMGLDATGWEGRLRALGVTERLRLKSRDLVPIVFWDCWQHAVTVR